MECQESFCDDINNEIIILQKNEWKKTMILKRSANLFPLWSVSLNQAQHVSRVHPARQLVLTSYFLVLLNLCIAFQCFLRARVYFS